MKEQIVSLKLSYLPGQTGPPSNWDWNELLHTTSSTDAISNVEVVNFGPVTSGPAGPSEEVLADRLREFKTRYYKGSYAPGVDGDADRELLILADEASRRIVVLSLVVEAISRLR